MGDAGATARPSQIPDRGLSDDLVPFAKQLAFHLSGTLALQKQGGNLNQWLTGQVGFVAFSATKESRMSSLRWRAVVCGFCVQARVVARCRPERYCKGLTARAVEK